MYVYLYNYHFKNCNIVLEKLITFFKDITLVTQCSINHLHHLIELIKVWNGPISCSIFVPNMVSGTNLNVNLN